MKCKQYTIIIVSCLLLGMIGSASFIQHSPVEIQDEPIYENIHIALLSQTPLGWDKRAAEWYYPVLDNYTWMMNNQSYRFIITSITDKEILSGQLTTDSFDVLLVPGGGVGDEQSIVKGTMPHRPRVTRWKHAIHSFIQQGGGFVGYCGGAALMADLEKTPETLLEKNYEDSAIGATTINIYYQSVANFYTCQFRPDGWKNMGAAAYMGWSAYTNDEQGYPYLNGVCFDISLNRNHPIYADYQKDTVRVRWIGGPALVISEENTDNVMVGGWYPDEKLSDNESMRVHYWKYTGGIPGLFKGYLNALQWCQNHDLPLSQAFIASFDFSSDWDQTDEYVDINQSNKPCIATEIYPNENKGRIVLNTLHPERNIWWDGYIQELPDTDTNSIHDGIYQLTDYIPFDETSENETTHTWWIVRRETAWAAKINEDHLPPINEI